MRQPESPCDRFAVTNTPRSDELKCLPQRYEFVLDEFISFGISKTGAQGLSQQDCHGLIQKSWAGIEVKYLPPLPGRVSGFFEEFALAGGQGVLAWVDPSRRQLQ